MTKKLTWEVDKTSLVLKVTDGAKVTTWRLRKTAKAEEHRVTFEEIEQALMGANLVPKWTGKPMIEGVRTVDAEELAELRWYQGVQAESEEASRAAQAREVARLNIGAKWFEADDDETYGIPIPDYDSGEVRPR